MTEQIINPRNFKVAVHKVRPMYRPKFYLAGMQQGGRVRLLRSNTRHKTYGAALDYANKVMKRWVRLYDAAVVAMSNPVPAPGDMP
jgi:hypothetical protein